MNDELRYSIRNAIAWRIMAELLRRHHEKHKLRLLILHPSGGMSRQLALFTDDGYVLHNKPFWRQLCQISLIDSTLSFVASAKGEDKLPGTIAPTIPTQLLMMDPKEVVDKVEESLRLSTDGASLPSSTPPVLAFRILTDLLERYAFSRVQLDVECGWTDTAGYSSCVSAILRDYPLISEQLPYDAPFWEDQAIAASRFWIIGKRDDTWGFSPVAVLDLRGLAYFSKQPTMPWNFWNEYGGNGHKLLPLVHRLENAM